MDLLAPLFENTADGLPVMAAVERTGIVPPFRADSRSMWPKLLSGRSLQRTGLRSVVVSIVSSFMA